MPELGPLAVWTTGTPVPSARRARGTFFDMICARTQLGFAGDHREVEVTQLTNRHEMSALVAQRCSGVIVTGSAAHLRHEEEWMKWTMEALLKLNEKQIPILGICFGHQMLGQAFGGVVDFNPNGREVGTPSLTFLATDPLLGAIDAEPTVVMTHLDSVVQAPATSHTLASTPAERHAALRFSDTCWGVQFHPEMDSEIVGYYLTERREAMRAEGLDVDALLKERRDSRFGTELLQKFARFCGNGSQFD